MSKKKAPPTKSSVANPTDKRGSEVAADAARHAGGPRRHGESWEEAAEDEQRGDPNRLEGKNEHEANDEAIQDPGTRGAVFGRGGQGLVERDEPEDEAGPAVTREQEKHGSRPG
jgi:hypothetical protein